MEFRPCIDIHNGQVKQIVGGTLSDRGNTADENFVSGRDAAYFASLYREHHLKGGHVILLNSGESEYYSETKKQAVSALKAYPGGLQAGGGITDENAGEFLDAGASHVIVTSFVFRNGRIQYENLGKLVRKIGREKLVLDLSCKKTTEGYRVVTDRWQNMTEETVTVELLKQLSQYCDEFLIHAVDVEGKADGIEKELVRLLGNFSERPVTYAGGIHSFEDLEVIRELGQGRVHVTIGSALDLFGGKMKWEEVLMYTDR